MKVAEILESKHSDNIQYVKSGKIPNFEKLKMLGRGSEARVYKSKGNSAIKTTFIKNIEDGTYQYINMVMDHQDNPFFPKIYSAKMYEQGDQSRYLLVINMEKLASFGEGNTGNDKTAHLFPILIKQLGLDDEIGTSPSDITDQNYTDIVHMGRSISDLLNTPKGRKILVNNAKNPQARQALELTSEIASRPGISGDLHDENLMVRLTAHGPQLVIVDPVLTT